MAPREPGKAFGSMVLYRFWYDLAAGHWLLRIFSQVAYFWTYYVREQSWFPHVMVPSFWEQTIYTFLHFQEGQIKLELTPVPRSARISVDFVLQAV